MTDTLRDRDADTDRVGDRLLSGKVAVTDSVRLRLTVADGDDTVTREGDGEEDIESDDDLVLDRVTEPF